MPCARPLTWKAMWRIMEETSQEHSIAACKAIVKQALKLCVLATEELDREAAISM